MNKDELKALVESARKDGFDLGVCHGRKEAEDIIQRKVERVIDDLCEQYRRTGYNFAKSYAWFVWAKFARSGSRHPSDRG